MTAFFVSSDVGRPSRLLPERASAPSCVVTFLFSLQPTHPNSTLCFRQYTHVTLFERTPSGETCLCIYPRGSNFEVCGALCPPARVKSHPRPPWPLTPHRPFPPFSRAEMKQVPRETRQRHTRFTRDYVQCIIGNIEGAFRIVQCILLLYTPVGLNHAFRAVYNRQLRGGTES